MTRTLTRELEKLIGGGIPRYKGVRWRPKRKHLCVEQGKPRVKLFSKIKDHLNSFSSQNTIQVIMTLLQRAD
jgi:hypothetical protein